MGGSASFTDLMRGYFDVDSARSFSLTGFDSHPLGNDFLGMQGGSGLDGLGVTLSDGLAPGLYSGSLKLRYKGYNDYGYLDANYGEVTLNLTGKVVAAVPEPAEWAMMLAGLGLVGAIAKRRRARAA